jgi:uncharacterized membrane protein required for colicin V production
MSWFLDGLAVFFMVYSGVVGFKRGFIEELGRLIGLLLAVVIAISNSTSLFIQLNGIINVAENRREKDKNIPIHSSTFIIPFN